MAYTDIPYSHITDHVLYEVFEHANVYLRDVYSMLTIDPKQSGGGACNFSIALVLLSLIDGLARDVYPTLKVADQGTRFRRLICDKLAWETNDDRWVDRRRAANVLYLELRNPLTHELAQDKITSARPEGYLEPAVVRERPKRRLPVEQVDVLQSWDPSWPVVSVVTAATGRPRYVVDCTALYWAVKKLVRDLADDAALIVEALQTRYVLDASNGLFSVDRMADKISRWARFQSDIERVWLFGSRVKGNNRLDSDCDIAIELVRDPEGDAGTLVWTGRAKSWERELSRLLRVSVDLEQYHEVVSPHVCKYVRENSRQVYTKSGGPTGTAAELKA